MNRNNQIGRNGPELVSVDLRGNATTRLSVLDRDAATETTVTRYPTSTTPATSVSSNGLLVASTSQTGVTTTFGYDELERQVAVTDGRSNTTRTVYEAHVHFYFIYGYLREFGWTHADALEATYGSEYPDTGNWSATPGGLPNTAIKIWILTGIKLWICQCRPKCVMSC